jgi:YegS/Rv2252/BmrU family lipid kinase
MRAALIVNPVAGSNRGVIAAERAKHEFVPAGWQVTRLLTGGPRDAARLARESAELGFDLVLACGGDGTLSQVLAGLLDTGIPAGIIPAGTGNDFARTIGLSINPTLAARQLVRGRIADIDLLQINDGLLWCVNVMGVGFDAQVTYRMSMNGHRRAPAGVLAYVSGAMRELVVYRPTAMRLRVDENEWEGEAFLLAVANARSYGAGMKIAPLAEVDDGVLDVVLVEPIGRVEFLRSFPKVLRGTHLTHPAVRMWKGKEVHIETPQPSHVLVDGDVRCQTPVHVCVSHHRAKLLMPGPLGST